MHPNELDTLNDKEREELQLILDKYLGAKLAKDYSVSDELRNNLIYRGLDVNESSKGYQWRPTLESSESRYSRWMKRNGG